MTGATFGGKRFRESAYISGIDVIERDLVVTIVKGDNKHKFRKGPRGAVLHITTPDGDDRIMRVNATNEASIVRLHGVRVEGWPGKQITLYFDPEVYMPQKGGGMEKVGGFRVRTERGSQQQMPRTEPDAVKSGQLAQELDSLVVATTTIEELEEVSVSIKSQAAGLTNRDADLLRGRYRQQIDKLTGGAG